MSSQIEGLLIKNFHLMIRQKASFICQIITPILCLAFIALIKIVVEKQLNNFGLNLKIEFPLFLNLNIYNKLNYTNNLIRYASCDEWYLYSFSNDSTQKDVDYFGYNDGVNLTMSDSNGILISRKNVLQTKCESNNKMTPYFIKSNNSINEYLYKNLEDLNKYDFNLIKKNENSLSMIPDGAIEILTINDNVFSYKLQINDLRLRVYHRSNGVTKTLVYNPTSNSYSEVINVINGALWACDLLNRAYFRHFFKDDFIVSGIQIFPLTSLEGENIQRIINISGSTFYPLAISLLMPLFMYTIILEKDAKLIEIMKINGLKMRNYWISNFISNMLVYSLTIIIFMLYGGAYLELSLFTQTSFTLLFVVFLGWGFNQIGMAFFFQAFLSNPRTATSYIISLWTTLLAVSLNFTIFNLPNEVPNLLIVYPTFTMVRIIYHMTMKCGYSNCISSISEIDPELKKCVFILYITPWVLIILGIYLYEIIPQRYGVRKHPLFFLPFFSSRIENIHSKEVKEKIDFELNSIITDEEIIKERNIIQNLSHDDKSNYPLVSQNLTKIYIDDLKKPKLALNNLNLLLRKNEIFALLGYILLIFSPNGAGKTTFFSLLTGIYESSSGEATVGGHNIKTQIDKVQQQIGYCPQFDILWNDLSVNEHLSFYSRLKYSKNQTKTNVDLVLDKIKLKDFKNFKVSELSGGMRRRLSLGISLIGDPSIVFLDEPTTGLDPENKRQIWEILSNCKENKCIILTTHIMEEAEVLSDRIGIIVKGQLKCLGTHLKLKRIYGKGFKLVINLSSNMEIERELESCILKCQKFLKELFENSTIKEKFKNTIVFQIPYKEFNAEKLFKEIEENKSYLSIINWAISQVSLEDIFIELTEKDFINNN